MSNSQVHQCVIPSCMSQAREVEDHIVRMAETSGYGEDDIFALKLSLEEAMTNAIRHGNCDDESKKVIIHCSITPKQIDIEITDEGGGFDPLRVPDPTTPENIERPTGRGVMLMRAYMDEVEFNSTGNRVRMVKRAGRIRECS